jgi:hypothetical protein
MSTVEHPLSTNQEQHHAFAERVASHVVTVVNRVWRVGRAQDGQNVAEQPPGMGAAVVWNGRRLILTAKHVIEDAEPKDIQFCTRADGPIDWGVRSANPLVVHPVTMKIDRIVKCRSEDLACIVLKPDQSFGPLEFLDIPAGLDEVPSSGAGTLIHGCPVDQNIPVGAWRQGAGPLLIGLASRPRGCWAVVEGDPPKCLPSSFDSERHFLLKFDPTQEGVQPYGFSGSGVWGHRRKGKGVWSANPVLSGIQFAWHRPTNLMFAVRSEMIREFLESAIS